MGLIPLANDEIIFIEGGRIPFKKIWDGTKWVVEKAGIVDFFMDFCEGFKEGYYEVRGGSRGHGATGSW